MTNRVIADFKTNLRHRFHLSVCHVPILTGMERIKVSDIKRTSKPQRFQDGCHNSRMAGRAIIKGKYYQFIRNGL